jgi:hypothetical protein
MKKYCLFFVIGFLIACNEKVSNNTKFHADKAYVENFVSQAAEKVIFRNTDGHYFNLMPFSFFQRVDTLGIRYKERKKYLKLHNFDEKDFLDTLQIEWKNYKIARSHVLTLEKVPMPPYLKRIIVPFPFTTDTLQIDSLNNFNNENLFVPQKKSWNKQEKQEAVEKWKKHYEDNFKEEDYYIYYISRPVFSKDGKYAVITISRSVTGAVLAFKIKKGKWIVDRELESWIR